MRAPMMALLTVLGASGLARADAPMAFVPHVEAGLGQTGESLTVPSGEATSLTETRDLYTTRLALGLDYGPVGDLGGGAVRGRSALAIDVLLGPGRRALILEQDLRWHRPLGPLVIAVGPGLAGRFDLEQPDFSTLEIGLPIGLRWGPVELDWRPAWRVPLGEDEAPVLGSVRRHGASSGINWLALSLRVHLTALAW